MQRARANPPPGDICGPTNGAKWGLWAFILAACIVTTRRRTTSQTGRNRPVPYDEKVSPLIATQPITIRNAQPADAAAIAEIYNEAILTTTATLDTEPKSVEERTRWLESRGSRHPVLVAMVDGRVVGWASLTRWSERRAYDDTAETSLYVHSAHRGRGIGRTLQDALIEEARRLGFHSLIARVVEGSRESLHLKERAGYVRVGTLKQVGRKFGRLLDVHIMQKMLDDA